MSRFGPTMGRPQGTQGAPDPGLGDQVEVTHACFECGGPLALIRQPACRVCHGKGVLTDPELDVAMRIYNRGQAL
jgi:hypothetical protein